MALRIRLSILPILGFLVLSAPASLPAQVGMITGKVTIGGSDRPLGQAQVIIEGTPISTVTNEAGEFRLLAVPAGPRTVLVRRLGFAPITQRIMVQVGQTATLDFTVREAAVALDEIVVTATGDQRRKEIANSMESIDMSKLRTPVISSPQQLLAAQVPGVTVLANSGQPGAGGTIRLRGNNSISQGNNPIVYVDGVRIYSGNTPNGINARQNTSPFNDIKAEDIERVDVVKGAAATTLYGTEASGGVIQIFTKRGRSGAPRWDATIAGGTNDLDYLKVKGDPTAVWLKECRGPNMFAVGIAASAPATFGQDIVFEDATCPASGKWVKKGVIQKYGLSVAGGGEVMQYFLAGNYNDEEGAIPTGEKKDGGFRGNFTFSPWRGLDLSLNTSYTKGTLQWVPDGNLANGFMLNVARGSGSNYKGAGCTNPAAICLVNGESIYKIHTFTRTDHFISGFTINYTPLQAWSNRLTIGFDYNNAENRSVTDFGQVRVPTGNVAAGAWNRKFLSIDYASTLKKALGTAFNSNVSLGGQIFQDQLFNTTANGDVLGGPGDPTLLSAAVRTVGTDTRRRVVNAGLFAQGQLSWKERAFFTAGLRVDGNSAFGDDFGLQPYPKVGLSYVVSEHAFWPDKVETFKIRGALGESGKAPGAFDAVKTWDPVAGDEAKPGFTPNQLGNPLLGPERTREIELGFEASAFDGRASVDFTWFNTRTNKALIQVQHPPSDGPWGRQLTNVGTVGNKGVEAKFDLGFIRSRVVDWRGRFNYTHMKSEAIDIGDEIEISIGDRTVVRKGLPVPAYYTKVLTNPNDIANPIRSTDNQYVGPVFPPTIMSVGTSVTLWGKFTLDGLGEFQKGGHNINYIGYQNANRGVWRPCYETQRKLVAFAQGNTAALDGVTALERARCAIATTVQNSDYWLEPADFFRLRYVSLSYRLPPKFVPGAKSATLTLSGRNLFLKTDYSGLDPESADQADNTFARREYYQLPSLRTFTIEMRVSW